MAPKLPWELETMNAQIEDEILTLTLNRPDRLNAFNQQMGEDWLEALDRIDADDHVRVVIVTGAGRGFCAGADLEFGGFHACLGVQAW